MRTWPGVGVGTGTVSRWRTSGPPGACMTAARIVLAAIVCCVETGVVVVTCGCGKEEVIREGGGLVAWSVEIVDRQLKA